ncbi:MAG: AMP-binding protein [Gemmatales bacterium]|nr:AMP-binding protein [Gemmatales bacterium]MDW7994816.1 AMP-binding protein [Gemmatales bacterium]
MSGSVWVDGLTFPEVLRRTVERWPQREAMVFPQIGYRITWHQFGQEVERAARALLALNIQPNEHVGIWATNWPQWVILQLATATVGAVLVNINPAYRVHELEYILKQADISVLFLTDRFKQSDYFAMLRELCPELTSCPLELRPSVRCPRLRHVISIQSTKLPGMKNWEEFLNLAEQVAVEAVHHRAEFLSPHDVVNIQYTSGTTGFPKGAMLTHRNLLLNAYYVGERLGFTENDRLCIPVPFYHCFGCVMGTLMCVIYGATMVVPAEVFDPLATLQAIHQERCTAIYGVPTMFLAELNHPRFGEFDLSSLRTGIMAGSPCPIELMKQVVEKMGCRGITIAYGLTEASPVITQTHTTDSLEHRVGTVGQPLPGLEVRIVKPGTWEDVAPGEPGELIVRGHGVMKGYYNKPAETAEVLSPEGWLRTGDLAMQTPDGYYRITGRIKDMIIRGGENIYPREIEEFLLTHPKILDVQVVGLPDEKYGEEVSAWIRVRPGMTLTEEEVRDFCRGRIAHYKIPRYIVFVDEYPTTVTGKVQKFKLREMGIERFGLQRAAAIETA